MSTATLGVTSAVDGALRKGFSDAGVRVRPDTTMTSVVEGLRALGVAVTIEDGLLTLKQGDTEMVPAKALKNFACKNAEWFILETEDPKTWPVARRMKYIKEHGSDAYGRLCSTPVLQSDVKVLDPAMPKSSYMNLTRAEKIAFLKEYGDGAVSRIFQRK